MRVRFPLPALLPIKKSLFRPLESSKSERKVRRCPFHRSIPVRARFLSEKPVKGRFLGLSFVLKADCRACAPEFLRFAARQAQGRAAGGLRGVLAASYA
jgi:hypothetical protein